ncbi:ABC-type multidrug transport system ATPase subunit [Parabacteroides sp. PF5-5]|uniref:ATP-binding cassette domain-containing protein n=1 Tax=unclassified Parabacteroides TaxID=2649774 RepID=UPI0024742A34|nr:MULTISPECIES: ATP-binding cassette domain-containing protein [unclassified Parabacteroides]MDH6304776.1 ABC-type multidrug transport system ATPase subunit [Parabacteroides sp. PH5-39]MDH6315609.1 ABC-type multidrug transport system ATPase subunit [Parabacteroides sp. PF5-13]MDH6319270.1 ABC-type multidrug transport system ATPase subunit [Parabacteroides sp. PH5-13]MDH6323001.1 ABC-type multidrug transport system ATPase subunit [Parabacteroides sp. PH5-8]MDH6326802.1 ABC-type multidrug trans
MNESILNGLLNLFAVFASIVKIENRQAVRAVHSYLSSHFGVRSHEEYIELYNELRGMYDDPDFLIDKENVIRTICTQMKIQLTTEEQLLLLVRFVEFAYNNSDELDKHLKMFHIVADIFSVSQDEFDNILAFIIGAPSPAVLTISNRKKEDENHIVREGMEGSIRVWFINRFDRYIYSYHGIGLVFMNDIPVSSDIFYTWQHSSVVRGPLFLPVYYSDLQAVFNKNKRKEIVRLAGRDIDFSFKNSRSGLHNLSFDLESGQLVAIMGGSGVGKSTLLGLMNGNIHPDTGSITINGYEVDSPQARQLIGFVPQDDLLIEELTVYQNLLFTARFCFDKLSEKELEDRVNDVLMDLDLTEIRDLQVGSPLRKTISGGQRKRLNIALELLREPAILYLDEPTSGLSSSDSEKVMMLLKEQTHRGRLIVVNIHQPSSEIYKLFDRLWLLDKGGYPIYDGNPIEAITYFKHAAKYTDQDISVCSTCGNVNPELILNIIDSKKIDDSGNQTSYRKFTPREWHKKYLDMRPAFGEVKRSNLPKSKQQKPSWFKQFLIFLERNMRTKIINRQYLTIALLEAPLLALIVALLTKFADEGGYTLLGNKNFVSYIFMSVIVVIFIGLSISAEEIIKDRTILKRERFLRLHRSSYLTSKMFYLFVLSGIQTALFILVGNAIIGVGFGMFFIWWSILWATAFLANLTGLWLSQTLNSIVSIYITIPLLLIPQILLCGVVIQFDDLNTGASDRNVVPLIGEMIPSRWAFEALMVEQYRDNTYNETFFPLEKEKFLAQYYKDIHLERVRSLVERYEDGDNSLQQTIENELPVLSKAARLNLSWEDEHYSSCLEKIDSALNRRAHNFTAYLEQTMQGVIKEKGAEWLNEQKKVHHNQAIEDLVLGAKTNRFYKEVNNRIYPKVGFVYLEPENPYGRTPFYSHKKRIGNYTISTYNFNILMLGFFAVLAIIAIFAEFPGRYFKQRNEY